MAPDRTGWLPAAGQAVRFAAGLAGDSLRAARANHVSLFAAGVAFWATLALFPALSMLVSLYGMLFDPHAVLGQLAVLQQLLPPEVYGVIAERLRQLAAHRAPALGTGLALSALVTFWSAANGVRAILAALNLIHGEAEQRGLLRLQLVSLGLTLGAILVTATGIAALVALPAMLHLLGLSAHRQHSIGQANLALLLVSVLLALLVLYRFGPSCVGRRWHLAAPGAAAATLLWLGASELFSFYVRHIALYHATYGPLAAAAGVLMWFYVTAFVVLLGAELNSQIERRGHARPSAPPPASLLPDGLPALLRPAAPDAVPGPGPG